MANPIDQAAHRLAVNQILSRTVDPVARVGGQPAPALSSLLHRACGGDERRFGEAVRIVELFIAEAMRASG